jgi:hypothetical protein
MRRNFLSKSYASPSPLVGEGGEGGREGKFEASTPAQNLPTPTPTPPHKGEGNDH